MIEIKEATEQELIDNERRKAELWNRLERVIPQKERVVLDSPEMIEEIRLIISGYILDLESYGEIPRGLRVANVSANPKRPGHLCVRFGIDSNCKKNDREELLGFLTGRLQML